MSAGDQVLLTAGAHAAVMDELLDLQAARGQAPWTAAQLTRYRELRVVERELRIGHARALRRFKAFRIRREQLKLPAPTEVVGDLTADARSTQPSSSLGSSPGPGSHGGTSGRSNY